METMRITKTVALLGLLIAVCWISDAKCQKDIEKASQCFKSRGIPKVDFQCDTHHMIKIQRAFHGITVRNRKLIQLENKCEPSPGHKVSNCTFCTGDCVDDSMNLVYDWSTCMGNVTCSRTVMQSYMPSCPGKDKFSDYLQVEYQCIPRADVIDVCSNTQKWLSEGYLMSPNYPNHYPVNQDCLCKIQADWNSKVVLSFYDLLLETRQGRCRADWLMLRQKGQKHRHCGAIMTGTKNVTSETNAITLQFHTDANDNHTQNFQYFTRNLKGFWLYFRADTDSSMQITCRRLSHDDPEVIEISADDADYNEVVSTKPSETEAAKKSKEMLNPPKTEGNTVMGDEADTMDQEVKTQRKKTTKKKDNAKENEVFKQSGNSATTLSFHQSSSALLLSSLLYKVITAMLNV